MRFIPHQLKSNMNSIIKDILNTLIKNNGEAYVIGGYVRDYLLGNTSYDIDIITNLTPDITERLFNQDSNSFGCVSFKKDNYNIDITTYRKELAYEKRKPIKIEYINSLEEDLLRRDFTINAICMDINGNIIDPLKGVNDLNNKVIKLIGNPQDKFTEDPLRILRAIRFATILNFKIDGNLYENIKKYSYLVNTLSHYRINEELTKINKSNNKEIGIKLLKDIGLNNILANK